MNYPNQLDDKNSLFEVKDLGRTSTSKPLNAVELEIEIDNPVNFPTGRHIVVVESEVIIISHRIDNILYVEKRGAFDTLSENHITNSKIGVVFTSAHYETLRDSIIDIQKEIWTYRKPVNDVLDDPQTIIPVENESYVVGLSPLNEFVGKENNIATWNGTSWDFISPQPAFEMYILNKGKYEFNGTSWVLNKDVEISNVNDLQNQLNNRYTKSENDILLNTKVDKETGKQLSTNDLTNELLAILTTKKVKNVTTDAVNDKLIITYTDDTVANLNINDIVTDVYVSGATLDATTNVLTLTSSNGGADVTVNLSDFVNSSELASVLSGKQDKLISGDNIKSINGVSLLGSGNIVVGVDTSTERLIDCYRRDFKKSMLLQRNGLI